MATSITVPRDPNTLSNYNNFRTTHTTVNFNILFETQQLAGTVVHTLKSTTHAETKEIILDSSYVDIEDVKIGDSSPKWSLMSRFEPYGSGLKIELEKGVPLDESIQLNISVKTTAQCTALQWLTPTQTSNKKHPYMFSQCQAIHARSIFPCQDTPDVKATFAFNITSPLPVVASGLAVKDKMADTLSDPSGVKLYRFEQNVPIPSYLFAIASGDIAMASIGPRSVVATSPEKLAECKWELEADTERYLQTAEKLVFPYAWGEYNVLILPPSFPYGGMENPIFTFATPSIISKDRENIDVIAHELSHSWSGNLVSPASWEHFWLNEGWTTYLERRIQAAVHGEAHRDFSGIIGWKALTDAIQQFGEGHEFTKLIIDLKGKDPDDAFSSIPYDKGATFLLYIEKLIGQSKFDKFIPHYFTTFKEKSLDSYDFKSCLLAFFLEDAEVGMKLNNEIDWDSWFYKPGFPPKPDFDTSLVDVVYDLAAKWQDTNFEPSKSDIDGLMSLQLVVFLEQLLRAKKPLTAERSRRMGEVYGLAKSQNIEVSNLYFRVGMAAGDDSVLGPTTELLGQVGRMKFVRPLYRGLLATDRGLAVETFEKNKDFYHPICRGMVEKDLFGGKRA